MNDEPSQSLNEFEHATCPQGCAANDTVLYEFSPFRVCRCDNCGLVRLDPRLAESRIADLYQTDYFDGNHCIGYQNYERDRPLYERTFAHRLKLIQRFKPQGKLLDIGCGPGYFLNVAATHGFDVFGLDLSSYAVEQCQPRFPGRVQRGPLRPGQFPDGSFDVITMFDLFEHVYEPREFVSHLHTITKDEGIVVITTPNQRSLLARLSGRKWGSFKIPEHVFFYSPETLKRIVAPHFNIEYMRSEGQFCSLEFLSERLKTLNRPLGRVMLPMVRSLGVNEWSVYANSGSMTAVLSKVIG